MRTFAFVLISIFSITILVAQTTITGGYISGTWTTAGSPYQIHDDITIHADSSLTIEPGVEVNLQGHYQFIINGIIDAIGTEVDSILFTAEVPATGWRGLRFMASADTSHLSYCIVEYGRATSGVGFQERRGGGIYCNNSFPEISHCTIRNNMSETMGGGICYWGGGGTHRLIVIRDCTIIDNEVSVNDGGGIYLSTYNHVEFENCTFSRNNSNQDGGGIFYYASSYFQFHFRNCIIDYNDAGLKGGGINSVGSTQDGQMYISDCHINNNSSAGDGGGIWTDNGNGVLDISNTTFDGNSATGATSNGGALYAVASWALIEHVTFSNNDANEGGAIYLFEDASPEFVNCTIVNNTAVAGSGLFIEVDCEIDLSNSILSSNSSSAIHNEGTINTLEYSDFFNNSDDITGNIPAGFGELMALNANGNSCDVYYNIFLDPMFVGVGDYHLTSGSPCIDAGDPASPLDPDGSIADVGAYYYNQYDGPIWYVSKTGSDITGVGSEQYPFATIQNGIYSSADIDTVLVQPGSYNESLTINRNLVVGSLFLTTADTSYISTTVIDLINSPINFTTGDSTCILTGFTITGGNSIGFGGGIRCIGTSPTISYNIIRDNEVHSASVCWGGGIFMEAGSSARILNNQIINNTATYTPTRGLGGGIYSQDSNPLIAYNTISNNSVGVSGGGIYFWNSQVQLFDNIISGNSSGNNGGGIFCDGGSYGVIRDNIIFADSADWYGGGIHIEGNSNLDISNNVIHSNWAYSYGGLNCNSPTAIINNNTFCYNESDGVSALSWISTGTDTIYNNIFYNNGGTAAVIANTYFKNCDFYGNFNGDFLIPPPAGTSIISTVNVNGDPCDIFGNIFLDPLFADTSIFDFHLTEYSPCIDAGDPTFIYDPDGTIIDIGAFYFDQTTALDPPLNVVIEIIGTEVFISWDPVAGATSYKLYSSNDAYTGFSEDLSGSFQAENWRTLIINEKKFFKVVACDQP